MEKPIRVRTIHLDYLYVVSYLSQKGERVTSKKVTETLGRSRSGVETLQALEDLDYIYNEDPQIRSKGKNWKLTEQGAAILEEALKQPEAI